jgi:hypothetical protein
MPSRDVDFLRAIWRYVSEDATLLTVPVGTLKLDALQSNAE